MSAGSAAEVQQRFERIIQGLASPLQEGAEARTASLPPTEPNSGDSINDGRTMVPGGLNRSRSVPLGSGSAERPPPMTFPNGSPAPPASLGPSFSVNGFGDRPSPGSDPFEVRVPLEQQEFAAAPGPWISQGSGVAPGDPDPDPDPPGEVLNRNPKRRRSEAVLTDVQSTMRYFPAMFTFFCMATFIMPIWVTYHISKDENVLQWITTKGWLVMLLFALYAVTHLIHTAKHHPVRLALVICLVGSSLILLLVGDFILLKAYRVGNAFAAEDCDTFLAKRAMEVEWQAARTFYANCIAKKAKGGNFTFTQAVMMFRITHCSDYEEMVATTHPKWRYLGYLEESYRCSGWCQEGEPIWTFASTADSCSSAVADVMFNKIQRSIMQVVIYTFVVLGFVSTTLITMGPILIRLGIEW